MQSTRWIIWCRYKIWSRNGGFLLLEYPPIMCLSHRVIHQALCYSETKVLGILILCLQGLTPSPRRIFEWEPASKQWPVLPDMLPEQDTRLVLPWGILAMVLSLGSYEHFITVSLHSLNSSLHIWELYISVPVWPRIFGDYYLTDTTTEGKMKFSTSYIRNQFVD